MRYDGDEEIVLEGVTVGDDVAEVNCVDFGGTVGVLDSVDASDNVSDIDCRSLIRSSLWLSNQEYADVNC